MGYEKGPDLEKNRKTETIEGRKDRIMACLLEEQVREELGKGLKKQTVLARLATPENRDNLIYILNNLPQESRRLQGRWLNFLLVALVLTVTVQKLYLIAVLLLAAAKLNQFSPLLLLDLIVPAINFYVMRELLRFHRQGYQFMAVLGVLALLRSENRIFPDLYLYLAIIALSIFLLWKMFPASDKLRPSESK
ncbi:hypothetical protein [Desulfolithobacter sp.]